MSAEPGADAHGRTLAALLERALDQNLDALTVRALIEEATEAGARRAMASLGLDDTMARADVRELRDLLGAWRELKRSTRNAVIGWAVKLTFMAVLLGVAAKLKLLMFAR